MTILSKLREQRTALAKKTRDLVRNHPESEEWTNSNQEEYDKNVVAIEKIDGEIKRHEKVLDLEAANEGAIKLSADVHNISVDEATANAEKEKKIFNAWLRGGVENLDQEQLEFVRQRAREASNTMSTTTGSEGGFLTKKEFAPSLLEALKSYGGMRQAATVIRTATGTQMDFPTADETSEEGEILGENAQAGDDDPEFGTLPHVVHKFSSKGVAVPFELLQDSEIDIESYIRNALVTRLGRITERMFTVGTGTGQPHGIVDSAGSGKVGVSGQTAIVTYDDLIDLEHSVDPAYRMSGKCGFMFHDSTLRGIRKLKDLDGRPIWLPGLSSADPNNLLNRPYTINQNIAPMGANAKSILFGDFSKYIIRDVMQVMMFRFTDSAYTKKGQVGFLAFLRSGGRLMDVGGAVKHYQNSAT